MSPFYYMWLIVVLSSSVIAEPVEHRQDPGESKLLLRNEDHDVRLPAGLWAEVKILAAPGTAAKWPEARKLDHVLQFTSGVETVNLARIDRRLMPEELKQWGVAREAENSRDRVYRAFRTHYGPKPKRIRPATTLFLLGPLHIDNCRSYLDDTYWGRHLKILGEVSDSLIILTAYFTMRFTEKIGPKCRLGGYYAHPMDAHS
jgi:hypothetical protein